MRAICVLSLGCLLVSSQLSHGESSSMIFYCGDKEGLRRSCTAPGTAPLFQISIFQELTRKGSCTSRWKPNLPDRTITVRNGCRANFRITFRDIPKVLTTDREIPIDFTRNAQLERALMRTLANSPMSVEERAQHALDRLSFGPSPAYSLRALVRYTNGVVDEAKSDRAMLRFLMNSLENRAYSRRAVENLLKAEYPDSEANYQSIAQKSYAYSRALQVANADLKKAVDELTKNPSPALEQQVEQLQLQAQERNTEFHRFRVNLYNAAQARFVANAIAAPYGFQNKLIYLWFNRLNVNAEKVHTDVGDYIFKISEHTHSRFGQMLLASARHPAMLIYLNNFLSRSDAGRIPNEDYGRELIELHSVGVPAGSVSNSRAYTLEDVRTSAAILAGWSVSTPTFANPTAPRQFNFVASQNADSDKRIFGRKFANGEQGGIDFIEFLSMHPNTANSISRMLVSYFVSEDLNSEENRELISTLNTTYLNGGGDLSKVYQALISHPAFWSKANFRSKVKDSVQQVVGTLRAAGYGADDLTRPVLTAAIAAMDRMGLRLFRCVPPTGYSISSSYWSSAFNTIASTQFAFSYADTARGTAIEKFAENAEEQISGFLEGGLTSLATRTLIARAQGVYAFGLYPSRFGMDTARYGNLVNRSMAMPDRVDGEPALIRTVGGRLLGSLELSVH